MIDYDGQSSCSILVQLEGSVLPRSFLFSILPAALSIVILVAEEEFPDSRRVFKTSDITESVVWSIFTGLGFTLIGFRMRTAYSRFWEGTTLLHQMQGEWFESASCMFAFSASARGTKSVLVSEFRQTLVRLMSLMHGSALEMVKRNHDVSYEVIDLRGLDMRTLEILQESSELYGFNRVEVLLHMVQVLMTHNSEIGVLAAAPPILSRVFQTLSRGMVNFINAQKIADTMFPFPFAQLCSWFVIFQSVVLPLIVTSIIKDRAWAAAATFVPMLCMHCLNLTAWELEMPYGDGPNDLPLEVLQKKFNLALLMLLRESADHIPSTSPRKTHDWESLFNSMWATSEMIKNADTETKRRLFKAQHLGRNTTKTLDFVVQVQRPCVGGAEPPMRDVSSDWMSCSEANEVAGPNILARFGGQGSPRAKGSSQRNTIRLGMQEFRRMSVAGDSGTESSTCARPTGGLAGIAADAVAATGAIRQAHGDSSGTDDVGELVDMNLRSLGLNAIPRAGIGVGSRCLNGAL
mmetsp:Transcript_12601/g.36243  ORF Transcript_12601/g.36243 Transcript_12601/m.36243 type:complete len:520 (+) Transcript_12601:131-1690(+)